MIGLLRRFAPSESLLWAIGVAVFLFTLSVAWLRGAEHERQRWEALDERKEAEMLKAVERAAKIDDRVIYRTIDRWRTVVEKGETIIREVPTYVSVQSDRRCIVPAGFARVHDAAADNSVLPAPAGSADEADSRIALSAVASTVAANYQQYHEVGTLCTGLQAWAREVSAAAGSTGDSP